MLHEYRVNELPECGYEEESSRGLGWGRGEYIIVINYNYDWRDETLYTKLHWLNLIITCIYLIILLQC